MGFITKMRILMTTLAFGLLPLFLKGEEAGEMLEEMKPIVEEKVCAPLTLDICLSIALDQNPLNRAAVEGIIIAQETVGVAKAPYYPEIGLLAEYSRFKQHIFLPPFPLGFTVSSEIGPFNNYNLAVVGSYTLFDSGLRSAQLRSALANQSLAKEEAARIQQEILLHVSVAFYSVIGDEELLKVAEQNLQRAEDHTKLAQDRKDVGAVPLADVLRARVEVANARQALVRAKSNVRISYGNLNTAMGLPAETPIAIISGNEEITSPKEYDLCEASDNAVTYRPEVMAQWLRMQIAQSEIDKARSQFGPTLVARGSYGRHDDIWFPKDQEWSIGVSLQYPLFKGFGPTHNLRRSIGEFSRENALYQDVLLSVRQDVWNSYSRLEEAYESVLTSVVQVSDAQESMRLSEERYRVGAGILTDMLDAQTSLARAQAAAVESRWKYQAAKTTFFWAQGFLCEPN